MIHHHTRIQYSVDTYVRRGYYVAQRRIIWKEVLRWTVADSSLRLQQCAAVVSLSSSLSRLLPEISPDLGSVTFERERERDVATGC